MADPKHPRKLGEESRRQIVQLYDNGKSPKEIKDEYDMGRSTLHRWAKAIRENGSTRAKDDRTPEQGRILELGSENERLRMEAGVSRTAALTFARRQPR